MNMLFDRSEIPRRKRRVLMHVVDAGLSDTVPPPGYSHHIAILRCRKCTHSTGWIHLRTLSEGKRGIPCPNCNKEGT